MELYHLLNRGVEKRNIVLDDADRARFIHDLFALNDAEMVLHASQPTRQSERPRRPRELLVHIHAFCLMNNHYHLLASEAMEQGISKFMHKLNMGYSKYFNEKYARSGVLWQGKHKKILVDRDAHFLYIPYYIHLNPLDYAMPEWRAGNVKNIAKALRCLEEYRWSSHLDYLGMKNFPSITDRDLLKDMLGRRSRYEKEIASIIGNPVIASKSSLIEYRREN